VRSHAPQASKRGNYELRNSSWAGVASSIEMPWLKGLGRTPCLNFTRTSWRIQRRTWPLAPMRSHSRYLRRTQWRMKEDVGEQKSARRATPSFLGRGFCRVARLYQGGGAGCCCCCCRGLAFVGCCLTGSRVGACRLVRCDLRERGAGSCLVGGMQTDFQRAVDERLA
jgi:hypothetical protein